MMRLTLLIAMLAIFLHARIAGEQDGVNAVAIGSASVLTRENGDKYITDDSSDCNSDPARNAALIHDVLTTGRSEASDKGEKIVRFCFLS